MTDDLDPMALVDRADGLAEEGREDEARALFERAIASGLPAAVSESKALLGVMLFADGDVDGGRALIDEGVAAASPPDNGRALILLGRVLNEIGDEDGAVEALRAGAASGQPVPPPGVERPFEYG
ncbi:tetratricopeptide repeat protein [Jiangella aurantiaca]|uniref:Tetratricopeptide repeat protein n=1 Tax=Jiangella aurantiaca TaxID=2530373 RepID=A0A4R5AA82_9ACTN|nr:tetratricopeptide repeat protein [Jiangella aurantiaca]TDD68006.1 tetratricopeptide repeat protein [Jiangella aurantiaca]